MQMKGTIHCAPTMDIEMTETILPYIVPNKDGADLSAPYSKKHTFYENGLVFLVIAFRLNF